MIRVRSSDELMQRTGQGDAYVFTPLNMDTFFKAREMKLRHEDKQAAIKAKQAKDLENRLTFNPGTATPEHDEEFNSKALEALEIKKNVGINGDPTGELEKSYWQKHNEAKQIGQQSKAIQAEMASAHGEIKSNPLINQTEAYKTLVDLHNNPDGKVKSVTDWKHGAAMTNVYANPNAVNTDGLFKTFAKNAGQQTMSIKTATENGDIDVSQMDKQVGKFLVPKKDDKGKVVGYQTDKDGNFVFDINDNTIGALYGTYPNPEAAKQRIESDYQKRIQETGLDPKNYSLNDYVADSLKTYVSTSTSRQRDYEDKAQVKAKDGIYDDVGGVTVAHSDSKPLNFTAKRDQYLNGQKVGETSTVETGLGFGFTAPTRKGQQLKIKVTNLSQIYDGNTASRLDAKNLANQDVIVSGVTWLPTERKTGKPRYQSVKKEEGESDAEYLQRSEEWAARNSDKYVLKPFIMGGTQEETGVAGDESANDTMSGIDKKIEGQNKNKGTFYTPFHELKAQLIAAAAPKDQDKFLQSLLYSPSKQRVDKLAAQYAAEKPKEVRQNANPTPANKPAAIGTHKSKSGISFTVK